MSEVEVRPMLPGDTEAAARSAYETFVELDTRLGEPVPPTTPQDEDRRRLRAAHLQRTDPDGAFVAEQDGRVVGVTLAIRRGPLWFLSLLTVEPHLQGQGVGARLLEAALRTCDGADAGWVLSSDDPKALRRYALAGFAPTPAYTARGPVDRALLPAVPHVRDEVSVEFLTGEQQWAIDVVLRARLALHPGSSTCHRGRLGPFSPYLPSGAYG